MDAVFGQENFKNEVVFERKAVRGGGRRWMWAHDTLLFYTGPKSHTWGGVRTPHGDDHWERNYRYEDRRGRYQLSPLTKAGRRYDHRDQAWGDYDPSKRGRFWAVPLRILRLVEPDRDDLDDLSVHTPEFAWLTEFAERAGSARLEGRAVDNQTVASFAHNLAQSAYFENIEIRETVREQVPAGAPSLTRFVIESGVTDGRNTSAGLAAEAAERQLTQEKADQLREFIEQTR